jgi:signal transduction histidine kinase
VGEHGDRTPLRVLALEDQDDDFELLQREIGRAGWQPSTVRAQSREQMIAALDSRPFDLVISDWSMPGFDALSALGVLRVRSPDLPFIIVSGTIGEEAAVRALKAGANDFVRKSDLRRLGTSILRELREARTRAERRDALEALRLAVKVRDEFLTMAGHELRTPLTTLRLQVQGILRSRSDGGAPERIEDRLLLVERSTRRLHALVDRLLDISQVAQQGVALQRAPTDLALVVRDAAGRFADAGAAAQLQIAASLPVLGNWDEARLDTLATNLISNALKYGEGRPVRVAVEDGGGAARLTVRDEGIGIDEADQARIFERFGRAVSDRRYGGFGIGLWLVREIASAHGGRVELDSAPGRGATFVVHLPKS